MVDTQKIQIALAAFGAGAPDGILGNNTKHAVSLFQSRVQRIPPTGIIDNSTITTLQEVRTKFPSAEDVSCKCGVCEGFGRGLNDGVYRSGFPRTEAYNQYEYPGISEMILWSHALLVSSYPEYTWGLSSGYRCTANNRQHGRTSTNHMGKALDSVPLLENRAARSRVCAMVRKDLDASRASIIGWSHKNKVSLEPSRIAPTWVHHDVRTFDEKWIRSTIVNQW